MSISLKSFIDRYGATLETTSGYTQDQLDAMNRAVWNKAQYEDEEDEDFEQTVKTLFDDFTNDGPLTKATS